MRGAAPLRKNGLDDTAAGRCAMGIESASESARRRNVRRAPGRSGAGLGIGIAGIHQPFAAVPTATLTGWNLRRPEFTDGDRHSTQLEQLDVEGILAFAERVLPK